MTECGKARHAITALLIATLLTIPGLILGDDHADPDPQPAVAGAEAGAAGLTADATTPDDQTNDQCAIWAPTEPSACVAEFAVDNLQNRGRSGYATASWLDVCLTGCQVALAGCGLACTLDPLTLPVCLAGCVVISEACKKICQERFNTIGCV